MRPVEVGTDILSYLQGIVIGEGDQSDRSRAAKWIPKLYLTLPVEYAGLLEYCSHYCLSNWAPANLLLPAVLVHLLPVQLQQNPPLVPPHIQGQIRVVSYLAGELVVDCIIYVFEGG